MPREAESAHDPLLHEVATALRDLTAALALYEQAHTLGWDDAGERLSLLMVGESYCERVLEKVVQREGDIIPTPPGGPDRWRGSVGCREPPS